MIAWHNWWYGRLLDRWWSSIHSSSSSPLLMPSLEVGGRFLPQIYPAAGYSKEGTDIDESHSRNISINARSPAGISFRLG
jgi:hypothetical protein